MCANYVQHADWSFMVSKTTELIKLTLTLSIEKKLPTTSCKPPKTNCAFPSSNTSKKKIKQMNFFVSNQYD